MCEAAGYKEAVCALMLVGGGARLLMAMGCLATGRAQRVSGRWKDSSREEWMTLRSTGGLTQSRASHSHQPVLPAPLGQLVLKGVCPVPCPFFLGWHLRLKRQGHVSSLDPASFPDCPLSSRPASPWSPFSVSQPSFTSVSGFCLGSCGFDD